MHPPLEPDNELIARLLREHGAAFGDAILDELDEAALILDRPNATVVFGGHFSAGKSSVVNLLTRRPLLPTAYLPETGIACELVSGPADRLITGDGRVLDCRTELIAEQVSLLGADGDYRPEIADGGRPLRIELAGDAIPRGARWIDSPGINDSEAMTERASTVAAEADVLVWVVNSQIPMTMVEQDFLEIYRTGHGGGSVALLVNVFLPEDTREQWDAFTDRELDQYRRHIANGLGGRLPEKVVFVSARAAADDPDGFGGPEAMALMRALSDPTSPLVRRARAGRAIQLVDRLAERVAARRDEQRAVLDDEKAEHRAREAGIAEALSRFEKEVRQSVDEEIIRWRAAAYQCGETMAKELDTGPIAQDGSYGRRLGTLLTELASESAGRLARTGETLGARRGYRAADGAAQRRLLAVMLPGAVDVEVPGKLEGRIPEIRPDVTTKVSGWLSRQMPKLSYQAKANIDRALETGVRGVRRARETAEHLVADRKGTQGNIRAAARGAGDRVAGRAVTIADVMLELYGSPPMLPAAPDTTPLRVLTDLLNHLARCRAELETDL